jgi:hypothetical protein
MTAREKALTEYLAERVCGWTLYQHRHIGKPCYKDARGVFERSCDSFDPLHDPRDTSIVMEAWAKVDDQSIGVNLLHTHSAAYAHIGTVCVRGEGESWTAAVCEAIGKASGFEWEGK